MPRKRKAPKTRNPKADHEKFLRKHGIDPTRKRGLRGAVANPLEVKYETATPTVPTSDTVPGDGHQRPRPKATNFQIAQVYNKGPLMVVTNFSELQGSKRRD